MSDPFGLVAMSHVTDGGVYYTPSFTLSGAISWSKLTTTGLGSLILHWFAVDPYNPLNRQYVLAGATEYDPSRILYTRNGGNWSEIMTSTIAGTLTGDGPNAGSRLSSPFCDPTTDGAIYVAYSPQSTSYVCYVLRSLDYGATWDYATFPYDGPIYEISVIGTRIWISANVNIPPAWKYALSPDFGATWYYGPNLGTGNGGLRAYYPHSPGQCYASDGDPDLNRYELIAGAINPPTTLHNGDFLASNFGVSGDCLWIDPYTAGHQRLMDGSNLLYTDDAWTTYSTTVLAGAAKYQLTAPRNTADQDPVIYGVVGSADIYALDTETDATPTSRNGVAPNNIPTTGGVAQYGIWVGYVAATYGAYVYADEEGDITDIPNPDNLGIPMFGDRSSWRDYDADDDGNGTALADYHAQDIQEDTPQRHAPWSVPAPAADYGIVSDGTKWIISTDELALVSDLHDAVTLDADAATILDLQGAGGQEIGLDVQNANTVLAGPAAGAANEPTFRALVIADMPADFVLTDELHQHTYQEDHTAECDGAETVFITANQFEEDTTMVWLNGVLQRPDVDYTEGAMLDTVTLTTAPENDDLLIIAYIVDLEI